MNIKILPGLTVVVTSALLSCLCAPAHAGSIGMFRAYVSPAGLDTNPCTLPQPCRLLPAALSKIYSGGEVWMLGSANYNTGTVTITKSATILAVPGALGSIVGNGSDAVAVTGTSAEVTLRNVNIVRIDGNGNGITVTGPGARVTVEHAEIFGFKGDNSGAVNGVGINMQGAATLTVLDTTIRNNAYGIYLDKGASASVSRSYLLNNNLDGLAAVPSVDTTVTAYVVDTIASGNSRGFTAFGSGTARKGQIYTTRTTAVGNSSAGFHAYGGFGLIALGEALVAGNGLGLYATGTLKTTGTNIVSGNSSDVAGPLTAIPLK